VGIELLDRARQFLLEAYRTPDEVDARLVHFSKSSKPGFGDRAASVGRRRMGNLLRLPGRIGATVRDKLSQDQIDRAVARNKKKRMGREKVYPATPRSQPENIKGLDKLKYVNPESANTYTHKTPSTTTSRTLPTSRSGVSSSSGVSHVPSTIPAISRNYARIGAGIALGAAVTAGGAYGYRKYKQRKARRHQRYMHNQRYMGGQQVHVENIIDRAHKFLAEDV